MVLISDFPHLGDITVAKIELWAFSLIRISFMAFLLPIFDGQEVPSRIKAGLTFFLSLILFPTLPDQAVPLTETVLGFVLSAVREIYVGLVMGFAFTFVFLGIKLAGNWISHETGFSVARSVNPFTQDNSSALDQTIYTIFALCLIATNGHLYYVRAIAESFQTIPLTMAAYDLNALLPVFLDLSTMAFVYGLKASAPILATLTISSFSLGIVARIMPQMNVWFVGMPLKIGMGVLITSFMLPLIWHVFTKNHEAMQLHLFAILKTMGT